MKIANGATLSELHGITFERILQSPVETVWAAISDEARIAIWMEYPTQLELVAGGGIGIDFSPDEPLSGIVCEAVPEQRLAYTWGESLVIWELSAIDQATRLVFSHLGVETKFVVGLSAGWHCFLDNLEAYLSGAPFPDRFDELLEQYRREIDG